MIPYEIDPSLHSGEPPRESLDDGFSPPQAVEETDAQLPAQRPPEALADKSDF